MSLMKAYRSYTGAEFELVQKAIPEPGETEVRIKVEACGIATGTRW